MRRIISVALIALCLSFLGGCRAANLSQPVASTADIQPAPTIVPPSDVYAGMLLDEFWELYPQREDTLECQGLSWGFDGYMFIYDDHNNPVVITYHSVGPGRPREDYYLTSVIAYDRDSIVISEATFRSIKEGMTLHDVVALVGNPYGNPDAAGLTLGWHCGEGIRFCVKWAKHPDDPNVLIVKNVYRADDVAGTYESIFN